MRVTALLIVILASITASGPRGIYAATSIPTPFIDGTFRALVIGNNAYRDPEELWRPLKTAVNDAEAVANVLREDYGFGHVRLLKNATRRQMIKAFNELAESARPNDSILIFYAGHGYLREETDEGFWIPVDAEGADDSTFVPNSTIQTKLSVVAARAKHVLLISDSCFSGSLLRSGGRGIRLEQKNMGYFRRMARKKSVQIMAAGGSEFVDDNYRNSGHSPFTYFFLNELRGNEAPLIVATDIFQQVVRGVTNNVFQTPERGILFGAGDENGEFMFRKDTLQPAPAQAAEPPPIAIGPVETPQAALPLVAPVTKAVGAAATSGGASVGLLAGGGLLLVVAIQQYLEAVDLNSQAQETAQSDPDRSAELEADRNSAATNALAAGLIGAGLLAWAIWGGDDDGGTSSTDTWRFAPLLADRQGEAAQGLRVSTRW